MKKSVLLIALLASTLTTWAQTEKYDLNGDGKVNVADVTVLVDYILTLQNPEGTPGDDDSNASSDALVGTWTKITNGGVIGIKFTADGKAYYNEWNVGDQPNFDNVKSPAQVSITTTLIRITHPQVSGYYEEYSYVLSADGNSVTFTLVGWEKDNHGLSGTFIKADSQGAGENTQITGNAPAGVVAVDLGLPSGTKWANMNVGAEKPEDYGLFFAWGETTGYTSNNSEGHRFVMASYKWCLGSEKSLTKYCTNSKYGFVDYKTTLEAEDDAANANWGGSWYMPTVENIQELLDNTTNEWVVLDGVRCRKFTSTVEGFTDKSIYLPTAGYFYDTSLESQGLGGYYWSSSLCYNTKYPYGSQTLDFHTESGLGANIGTTWYRSRGHSVRPVLRK